ncbi:hypothetical protein [Snodgrassella communis]|nr:hypothetical protein [Snodgrassella communis]
MPDPDDDKYTDYKKELRKGDKIDLKRFNQRLKSGDYTDPKTG